MQVKKRSSKTSKPATAASSSSPTSKAQKHTHQKHKHASSSGANKVQAAGTGAGGGQPSVPADDGAKQTSASDSSLPLLTADKCRNNLNLFANLYRANGGKEATIRAALMQDNREKCGSSLSEDEVRGIAARAALAKLPNKKPQGSVPASSGAIQPQAQPAIAAQAVNSTAQNTTNGASNAPPPPPIVRIDNIRLDRFMLAFEKSRAIGNIVIDDIKNRGAFFNSPQGFFVFDFEYRRAFPLEKNNVALGAFLEERYGINAAEYQSKTLLATLQKEAFLHGEKIEIRRLAHYDAGNQRLYLSRFDGSMYRLDGSSVDQIANGTDSVYFFDAPNWEPYTYVPDVHKDTLDKLLIESVNFADDGSLSEREQRLLLKLWVLALFFPSIHPTKPMLLFLGEKGGGKSSAQRRLLRLVFGGKAELYALEEEKPDGLVAAITSDPIVALDNVDERIKWLPDVLARVATGTEFARRELYTTNTMKSYKAECWLCLNGRTTKFMEKRDDLPDRTIVLRTRRIESFVNESLLLTQIKTHRDEMWSELINELQAIVQYLRRGDAPAIVRFRMADFATFALQVAAMWNIRPQVEVIFQKLEKEQTELVFAEDPIADVLVTWLGDVKNHGRKVDSTTLQREWSRLLNGQGVPFPYQNGRALGQRLSHVIPNLRQKFRVEVEIDSAKVRHYRFWPKTDLAESLDQLAFSLSDSGGGTHSAVEG